MPSRVPQKSSFGLLQICFVLLLGTRTLEPGTSLGRRRSEAINAGCGEINACCVGLATRQLAPSLRLFLPPCSASVPPRSFFPGSGHIAPPRRGRRAADTESSPDPIGIDPLARFRSPI